MPITDIPALNVLRTRMQWQQERQRVLAENTANSDTPNYKPRELAQPDFDRVLAGSGPSASIAMTRTSALHISTGSDSTSFTTTTRDGYEILPAGNAVNLEDEMHKSAMNQVDFAAATSLYSKSLSLLKLAIGK
jgi:flagellar basal-body rod protein FlgB